MPGNCTLPLITVANKERGLLSRSGGSFGGKKRKLPPGRPGAHGKATVPTHTAVLANAPCIHTSAPGRLDKNAQELHVTC